MGVTDMGDDWVKVRNAVEDGTARPTDKGLPGVVIRWEQLVRYACLNLGQQLGVGVQPVLSRKEIADPNAAIATATSALVDAGRLRRDIRIPGAIAPLTLEADLRSQRVSCSLTIDAPKTGRPLTRVNWLVRQLAVAPDGLRIDVFVAGSRAVCTSELLSTVREDPGSIVPEGKDIRSFRLVHASPMGAKRGKGRGTFIGSVLTVLAEFYEQTAQGLKPWAPAAPKVRDVDDEIAHEAEDQGVARSLVSTAPSTQDGPRDATARATVRLEPEQGAPVAQDVDDIADDDPPLSPGFRRVPTGFRVRL